MECFFISQKIDILLSDLSYRGMLHSVEEDIEKKGFSFHPFRKSVTVTGRLIEKIKGRVGETPIIAFSVDNTWPYSEAFRQIFRSHNILFIEDIHEAIRKKGREGFSLLDGTHWSPIGHRIGGTVLAERLRQNGYGENRGLRQ